MDLYRLERNVGNVQCAPENNIVRLLYDAEEVAVPSWIIVKFKLIAS